MLNENIKAIRKSKGLSQQELAIKLNVVRQTISKWEQGLSVPDSDMLVLISEVLETPVSTFKSHFRKIGGDKLATGTKENYKKKNYSLVAYFVMCNHSNSFCNLIGNRKPLLEMEL